MGDQNFRRLQISGLYLIAFMGLVMHMLMAVFEMAVSSMKAIVQLNAENVSVEPSIIEKFSEMSNEFSDSALAPIMFTFIALSLLIVVLPMITEKRRSDGLRLFLARF